MIEPIHFNLELRKCEACLQPAVVAVHDCVEMTPVFFNGRLWPFFRTDDDKRFFCKRHARPPRIHRAFSDETLRALCELHGLDPAEWPSLADRNATQANLFDVIIADLE